ncbi:MAG: hypothetical protein LBD71_00925, partial [Treponema sp.]|nr:hypothetical protein [Treponema sp.]
MDADPAPDFISIYSCEDGKAGRIPVSGDTVNLNIGNPTGFAARGDYIIAGGNRGTRVLRIDPSGAAVSVQTPGSHWIQDNRKYVLESVEGYGTGMEAERGRRAFPCGRR